MRILVASLMILLCLGCSNTNFTMAEITVIEPNQVHDVLFTDHQGRVTIIYNTPETLDFVVWVSNLNPATRYQISVEANEGNGVMFGPEGNLDIKLGSLVEDTQLSSNIRGELYVSMLNPKRIFAGSDEVKIVVSIVDGTIVAESAPFKILDNGGNLNVTK